MLPLRTFYRMRMLLENDRPKFQDLFLELPKEIQSELVNHWYFARDKGHITRVDQIMDWEHKWFLRLYKPGRRWGKTYCGAHNVVDYIIENNAVKVICIGPSFGDVKDKMIEGPSGILKALEERGYTEQHNCDSREIPTKGRYSYNDKKIRLDNGSLIQCYTAAKASKLRGEGISLIWADEMLCWFEEEPKIRDGKIRKVWTQMIMVLSEAVDPRIIITSTPTPTLFLRDVLYARIKRDPEKNILITGSLHDNPHLSESFKKEVEEELGGTRLGRQEIDGCENFEIPGALWKWKDILRGSWVTPEEAIAYYKEVKDKDIKHDDAVRLAKDMVKLDGDIDIIKKKVIGVDPSVSEDKDSDEAGLVCALKTVSGKYAIFRDDSGIMTPDQWSRVGLVTYKKEDLDMLIYEKNNGGALIKASLKLQAKELKKETGMDHNYRFIDVWASRGKFSRAEQPAMLYEKHLVYHIGKFPELEDQMTTYSPTNCSRSPDRLDAAVWALIHLSERDKPFLKIF